ncbi:MAG: hypothetical protein V1860_03435 [bacterium]
MSRKIINIILIIFAALFQISFLNNQIIFLGGFNLILILLIFISLLNYEYGLYFILLSALVLELYSPYPAGLLFFSYFITFLAIIWMFRNFFTNKSLYSLIVIGFIGTLCYNILFYVSNEAFFLLNMNYFSIKLDGRYFINLSFQLIFNLMWLAILFIFFRIINKKMRAAFIIK